MSESYLQNIRLEAGFSPEEISHELSISTMMLLKYEAGEAFPTALEIRKMAEVYEVSTQVVEQAVFDFGTRELTLQDMNEWLRCMAAVKRDIQAKRLRDVGTGAIPCSRCKTGTIHYYLTPAIPGGLTGVCDRELTPCIRFPEYPEPFVSIRVQRPQDALYRSNCCTRAKELHRPRACQGGRAPTKLCFREVYSHPSSMAIKMLSRGHADVGNSQVCSDSCLLGDASPIENAIPAQTASVTSEYFAKCYSRGLDSTVRFLASRGVPHDTAQAAWETGAEGRHANRYAWRRRYKRRRRGCEEDFCAVWAD